VHNSEDRYGNAIDTTDAKLLEARILVNHLNRPDDAHSVLESLKREVDSHRRSEILALDSAIAPYLSDSGAQCRRVTNWFADTHVGEVV
jgi:hypothetical protein